MRVIEYPYDVAAYNRSFNHALRREGAEVVAGDFSVRWIMKTVTKPDIVHIHWPSFYYCSAGSLWVVGKSFVRFMVIMLLLKVRSRAMFWTAHNLVPHQRNRFPLIDVVARWLTIKLSGKIFVHGAEVEKVLAKAFKGAAGKCVKIPHGNWIMDFPSVPATHLAREKLGIPKRSYIYLMFGHGKRYKNIETLISAFKQTAEMDSYLLVAGEFSESEYLHEVRRAASGMESVRIDAKYICDDDVPLYLAACDVVCLPYREILTSGTAMLAFSFGKPIISIDCGFLRDVTTESCGILFDPDQIGNLESALLRARQKYWSKDVIVNHARQYTFAEAAQTLLREINAVGQRQSRRSTPGVAG